MGGLGSIPSLRRVGVVAGEATQWRRWPWVHTRGGTERFYRQGAGCRGLAPWLSLPRPFTPWVRRRASIGARAGHRAVRRVKRRAAREGAPRSRECIGRGVALGLGVAGPPRRARTMVYCCQTLNATQFR
jgi:hypothetical protein